MFFNQVSAIYVSFIEPKLLTLMQWGGCLEYWIDINDPKWMWSWSEGGAHLKSVPIIIIITTLLLVSKLLLGAPALVLLGEHKIQLNQVKSNLHLASPLPPKLSHKMLLFRAFTHGGRGWGIRLWYYHQLNLMLWYRQCKLWVFQVVLKAEL